MNNRSFRWRAFVSFILLGSFLLSALSGVILFLRPEGSLAAWSGWSALGLDKKDWEALHAVAIFFFLLWAAGHVAFNGRALVAYCRRRAGQAQGANRFRELFAAALLTGLVVTASLGRWLPARWIVDLRAWFKSGAAVLDLLPPVAAAEQRTLAELGRPLGMDGARLLAAARASGIRVESLAQTLAEVARVNGLSPEKVYIALKGKR